MLSVNRSKTFLDLFSGAGGMSHGFHAHPAFRQVGAYDAEIGKPSSRRGALCCNATFGLNHAIEATALDLADVSDAEITAIKSALPGGRHLDVLAACPPCTGYSRANPANQRASPRRSDAFSGRAGHGGRFRRVVKHSPDRL